MTEAEEIAQQLYDTYRLIRSVRTMETSRMIVSHLMRKTVSVQMTDNIAEALLQLCRRSPNA